MSTTINLSDPISTWVTKTNTISSDLGTKASLNTTNKTNLVAAINELKSQSEKTDSSTILQLIDANNYLDSSRVDSLIPKFGSDFVDSAATLILIDANSLDSSRLDPLLPKLGSHFVDSAESRKVISVTDAGGDGSMAYNNSTGVITYTGPSAADVRAHFSAGTGIGLSSGAISNTGVTSIVAGTNIAISGATGAVTITNNISAGNGLSFSGGTLNMDNGGAAGNVSGAISSGGSETSFTASTYPTFISGRTNSSGGGAFTVTVGGSGHTLSMQDGDGGTYDTFATFLPPGATVSGNQFQYVAVQMRPS